MKFAKRVDLKIFSLNKKLSEWGDECVKWLGGGDSFTMHTNVKSPRREL